jgi:CheY-like chemotaxis protein
MSHEMRTPLNGVTGLAEALAGTRLDKPQRDLVDGIAFASATLERLIGDLLALSRGDEREPHPAAPFQLRPAVQAGARPFALAAEAKGLAFVVEVAEDADRRFSGDSATLGRLLSYLLSNGVKFTERGGVRLSVRRSADGDCLFEIADTGVGFDAARKAELFEAFAQADDGETRSHGGAGVGLALARQLAAELGGTLEAHSSPDEGSVFSFAIPLAEVAACGEAPADEICVGAPRVLIVDDNPVNRQVLELILDQVGVACASVENGLLAVEAARSEAFAAILMDIQMPVMDGITATREIRRIESERARPPTPVIIVSANCQPEQVEAGVRAGAQRHIGKPISAQALIEALNDVLNELPEAA